MANKSGNKVSARNYKQVKNKDWMDKRAHGKQPKQRLTKKVKRIPKGAY